MKIDEIVLFFKSLKLGPKNGVGRAWKKHGPAELLFI